MKEGLFILESCIKILVYFSVHTSSKRYMSPFIDHNAMHLVYLPKFCIAIVSNFFWEFRSHPKKNQRQWLCKISGGGGASKVHYGLCEISIFKITLMIIQNWALWLAARSFASSRYNHRAGIITLKASSFQNGSQICWCFGVGNWSI